MNSYKALQVSQEGGLTKAKIVTKERPDLQPGEVLIRAQYSSVNYKDALAVTGKGKILRQLPMVAGIDVGGVILQSTVAHLPANQTVIVTGCGLGENIDGGFSELVKVPAGWVIPLPKNLTLHEAMIYGTAGFTAGLCLARMEQNGQSPELGPIVVTGASGGVGSLSIPMLVQRGYSVLAVSGKADHHSWLLDLGARAVVTPEQLALGSRPLESVRFGGAIDNVGGDILSKIVGAVNLWGNVASVGLAASPSLSITVMPLILRGVSLLGISSANCPRMLRERVWERLATDLKPPRLEQFERRKLRLDEISSYAEEMMVRKTTGRAVVIID